MRYELLTELLPLALATAANPPAVIAVVIMLSSEKSRPGALWFTAGWLVGLFVVGAAAVVLSDALGYRGGPSTAAGVVKALIGLALIGLAIRKWLGGTSAGDDSAAMPSWMQTLTGLSPWRSFGFAALFAGVNPKTLALNIAGALVISEIVAGPAGRFVTLAVFAIASSLTLIVPLAYGMLAPEHSRESLGRTQRWLVSNNRSITAAVLGILGVMVMVSALQDLLAS